jgi:hypothetical protein
MRRSLALLCVLACYTATPDTARRSAETLGEWSSPINVGPPVNTEYNDNYAFLSRDELTMYFTSDRPGGPSAVRPVLMPLTVRLRRQRVDELAREGS